MKSLITFALLLMMAGAAYAQTQTQTTSGTSTALPHATGIGTQAGSPTYQPPVLAPSGSTFGAGSIADPNTRAPDAFGMTTGTGVRGGLTTSPELIPLYPDTTFGDTTSGTTQSIQSVPVQSMPAPQQMSTPGEMTTTPGEQ